jgi:hypothetical protein
MCNVSCRVISVCWILYQVIPHHLQVGAQKAAEAEAGRSEAWNNGVYFIGKVSREGCFMLLVTLMVCFILKYMVLCWRG